MIYANSTALPREELAAVVVQGNGMNKGNIWPMILPPHGVNKLNGHLLNINIASAEALRIMDKIVAPGGDIERISLSFEDSSYELAIRKEEVAIPDEVELQYAEYFSTEAFASQQGADKLELTHEYLTANAILSTATFGAATNSAVAYTVANLTTLSLIADITAALERGEDKGEVYNTVIIPSLVFRRARLGTLVQNFVIGQLGAQSEVTTTVLQRALADFGIERVLLGSSRYNSAEKGATPVLSKIWGTSYIWVGRTDTSFSVNEGGVETIAGVGASLYWDGYGQNVVETYRDEPKEQNIVRSKTSQVPWIANTNAGTLIATQWA